MKAVECRYGGFNSWQSVAWTYTGRMDLMERRRFCEWVLSGCLVLIYVFIG